MSSGIVDIYEVKRSQRHLLAAIENNGLVSPIHEVLGTLSKCLKSVVWESLRYDQENYAQFLTLLLTDFVQSLKREMERFAS